MLTQSNLSSAGTSIAVTDRRIYVIPGYWNTHEPITVVGLDRASGNEVSRWSIPREGKNAASSVFIYASPDGSTLYLLDLTIDASGAQTTPPVYLRVRASDGHVENRHELTAPDGERYFPTGRIAPDGHTLYTVGAWMPTSGGGLAMQFFDLDTGTLLPSLELPFQSADGLVDHEEAVSPDGRSLYVLSPTTGEVAIVDVESRSIKQVVPIKGLTASGPSLLARIIGTLRGLVVQQAAAKFYFSGDMQLSPDGTRLYALGLKGSGYEAMPAGVIAIDTTNWQVVDRWLPDTQINFLQLGGDGSTLYVQTSDSSGRMQLTTLDTRTGVANPVDTDVPGYVSSLRQIYLQRYGKLPGTSIGVSAPSTPLAQLDVSVDRSSILAGDSVTIDARFVDPRSGQLVEQAQKDVQFDPPTQVNATFYHGQIGTDDVVIPLQQVGYGHYRGNAVLKDPKVWSIRVDATRANAPGSRATLTNAITVQAAFPGTDGRRYVLKLTTDPAQPPTGKETTVRVAFVDAEQGTPLPDSVDLTDGAPTPIDAAFFLGMGDPGQASAMTSLTLHPARHGRYEGTVTFKKAGSWSIQINSRAGNQAIPIPAGTLQVKTP